MPDGPLGVVVCRISSGNSFVHETEGQLILNGSYNIDFTMDHEVKDLILFDELGKKHDVPLELSPLCVDIMRDGLKRYGPRSGRRWWSNASKTPVAKTCAPPGFPEYLTDNEPEAVGAEVIPRS